MNPGELKHRITLLYPDGTIEVDGVDEPNYVTASKAWAKIWAEKSSESDNQEGKTTYKVKMRYRKGIKNDWIIHLKDKTKMKLLEPPIDPNMNREFLILKCQVID